MNAANAKVPRWAVNEGGFEEEHRNGDYVHYTDFAAMEAKYEAERAAREAAEATVEALKEIGPVLSECRWFLVDMHIWPRMTTVAMSVDLLPKVDAVIVKAHAALGHPASTTAVAAIEGAPR